MCAELRADCEAEEQAEETEVAEGQVVAETNYGMADGAQGEPQIPLCELEERACLDSRQHPEQCAAQRGLCEGRDAN